MKLGIAGVMLISTAMSCSVWAQTNEPKEETHKNTRTVTGCLDKKGSNDYRAIGKDGSTWGCPLG